MSSDARFAYRQTLGNGASPLRLIILLYEQLIEDLRRAAVAIDKQDIEARSNQLNHALEVLGQLEAALNPEAGQQVAQNLDHFYRLLRYGLFQVQVKPDRRILEKYLASLLSLREAWVEVERRESGTSVPANPAVAAPYGGNQAPVHQGSWKG